eukprot:GAFH01003566.1.p4 GENE.GAFH01003566.1~~GAFH01003566.1.p4  ORF type:complete len:93 (+),score=14.76 GAFH01003566.1:532-810(+)
MLLICHHDNMMDACLDGLKGGNSCRSVFVLFGLALGLEDTALRFKILLFLLDRLLLGEKALVDAALTVQMSLRTAEGLSNWLEAQPAIIKIL